MNKRLPSVSIKENRKRRLLIDRKRIPALERLESRTLLSAISWISGRVGNFNDASNWQGGVIPGTADDVTVQGSGSVVNITDSEQSATITTGPGTTIDLNPSSASLFRVKSGTIGGTLLVDTGAELASDGGGTNTLTVTGTTTLRGAFLGGTLSNSGSMSIAGGYLGTALENSGTLTVTDTMVLASGSTLTNLPLGTLDITGTGGINPSTYPLTSSGTLNNQGTLNITAGTGTQTLNSSATFQNLGGTINVLSGTFSIAGLSHIQGGLINVSANATFSFDGTNYVSFLFGTIVGTGAGTVLFDTGTFVPAAPDGTSGDATLNLSNGLVTVNAAFQNRNIGNRIINAGALRFTGYLAGDLANQGTLTIPGSMTLANGSTLTNLPLGTLDITGTGGINPSTYPLTSSGTLNNQGTLNITAGTGTQILNSSATFKNVGGTVNVLSGKFSIAGLSLIQGGSINPSANATFSFDGPFNGTNNFSGLIGGTGAGTVLFNTGYFTCALPDGTAADATLNFPSGMANITGAVFDNRGLNNLINTGVLSYVGALPHGHISMINQGIIRNTGNSDIPVLFFTNDTTGLLDLQTDAGLTTAGYSLLNRGTLRKSGGTGVSIITTIFNNFGGTIDIQSGSVSLRPASSGDLYEVGPLHIAAGSTLDIQPYSAFVLSGTMSSTGGGIVTLTGGYVRGPNDFSGSEGTNPGVLDFAPNTFYVEGGGLQNGNTGLTNAGYMNFQGANGVGSFTNNGTVVTDASPLVFNGVLINGSTGVFDFGGDASVTMSGSFANNGRVVKSGGNGTVSLASFGTSLNWDGNPRFSNHGTIESSSGTLQLASDFFHVGSDGNLDLQSGATLKADAGGTITVVPSVDVSHTAFTTIHGTVILGGAGASIPALSGLSTNNGSFQVYSGASFTTAGALTNTGSLSVGGTLTIFGDFTQHQAVAAPTPAPPTLDFAVGGAAGTNAAPDFTVHGHTVLAGNLTAEFAGGFATASGTNYTVAHFASAPTGAFAESL